MTTASLSFISCSPFIHFCSGFWIS